MITLRSTKNIFSWLGVSRLGIIGVSVTLIYSPLATAGCLDAESLKALDYTYEQALRAGDKSFLDQLLAGNFVWIHNHGVQLETKDALLGRFDDQYKPTKSREQADVQVSRLENTAVIYGSTTVQEMKADGLHINTYRFLRTYVLTGDGCKLLAGQTMKTWSSADSDL